jgi:hypothetical protein
MKCKECREDFIAEKKAQWTSTGNWLAKKIAKMEEKDAA